MRARVGADDTARPGLFTALCRRRRARVGILSVYVDRSDQSHVDIKEWLQGGKTPWLKEMLNALGKIPPFDRYFFCRERARWSRSSCRNEIVW
jgi:hypothetical protein